MYDCSCAIRRTSVKAKGGFGVRRAQISIAALLIAGACTGANVRTQEQAGWPAVSGSNGGGRYTALTEINKDNVSGLRVAWEFRTGDYNRGRPGETLTAFQATPILAEQTLFLCSPNNQAIALEPETGKLRWRFDARPDTAGVFEAVCRGVAYWRDAKTPEESGRIFMGTVDGRLIALNAKTGAPEQSFGLNGAIDLKQGVGEKVEPGEYYMTSPPLVVGDLVLTGAFVKDVQRVDAPSGAVRAFDARTGELRWAWDPVPPNMHAVTAADVKKGRQLTAGTPNVWGIMSADPEEKLVFLGTGNPAPDHYGGPERKGLDYFGSSIIALDSETGDLKWRFQTVRHDLWDYDVGVQPVFYQHRAADGSTFPAIAAGTKLGFVFLLDARTGQPIFPIKEMPVPPSNVPGEQASPTQPYPTLPEPFLPEPVTRENIFGINSKEKKACLQAFEALDYKGPFTPPSERGALQYPGLGGGINWGAVSIDPERRRMIVNVQHAPFTIKLVPRAQAGAASGSDLVGFGPQNGTPYGVARGPFLSPSGKPCVARPWGELAAVDLDSGQTLWRKPFGTLQGQAPLIGKFLNWGTPNLGGATQTKSGIAFIAATMDNEFRAIDTDTGKILWSYRLPKGAFSSPMTFKLSPEGRQYVVIAAGGHGALGQKAGDAVFAFALPQ